jgi:hypothetical protein
MIHITTCATSKDEIKYNKKGALFKLIIQFVTYQVEFCTLEMVRTGLFCGILFNNRKFENILEVLLIVLANEA